MVSPINPHSRSARVMEKMTDAWEQYQRSSNSNPYSIKADGPADGYVDPKPYWEVGVDCSFFTWQEHWKYYKFPEDVDVGRRGTSNVAAQSFLNDMFLSLAEILNEDSTKTIGDTRREFQMAMIRDKHTSATVAPGSTQHSRDYERRMLLKKPRQRFFGYMGIQHIPTTQTLEEKLAPTSLWNKFFDKNTYVRELYDADSKLVDGIMAKARMGNIDVTSVAGNEDYQRLTAWHGISDEDYMAARTLTNSTMRLPTDGYSLLTPRWGEIEFLALGPEDQDGILYVDPESNAMRWADTLFWPNADVVGVWVRGQIRSQPTSAAILDSKSKSASAQVKALRRQVQENTDEKGRDRSNITDSEVESAEAQERRVQGARTGLLYNHPMLDNVEIIVAVRVRPAQDDSGVALRDSAIELDSKLKTSRMSARPLRNRQKLAFQSTFPGSPVRVVKPPRHNRSRPELSNVMYPGILSMSGIARNASKASPDGAIVGLEDAPDSMPVRANIEDPAVSGGSPGFGVFGRVGSGKTQFMLNFGVQNSNLGYRWIFMNPPKTERTTLKPFFTSPRVGGVVLKLSYSVLQTNPGLIDPFAVYAMTKAPDRIANVDFTKKEREELREKYTTERSTISSLAFQNIAQALSLQTEDADLDKQETIATLRHELMELCRHPDNSCLGHVIFGNGHTDPASRTEGLSNERIKDLIRKMMARPFWRAFVAEDDMTVEGTASIRSAIENTTDNEGTSAPPPILVEWDTSMQLPADGSDKLSIDEMDAVLNVQTVFMYAVYLVSKDGQGGLVTFDEAHLLANSPEIFSLLDRSNRLLREGNATIMLGSQGITDLNQEEKGGRNLLSRLGRSVCLALGENTSEREWQEFSRQFGWGGEEVPDEIKQYLIHASPKPYKHPSTGKTVWRDARGYYKDDVLGSFAGKLSFVWPDEELRAGRTDKGGYELRSQDSQDKAVREARKRHLPE